MTTEERRIYRVIQEKRSVFWELVLSVIVRNVFIKNVYLILNVYRSRALGISILISLFFFLRVWMKREIYERRVARIVDAAARLKKGEDQLRRKTRGHHARAAKSIDVSSEIFEHLF